MSAAKVCFVLGTVALMGLSGLLGALLVDLLSSDSVVLSHAFRGRVEVPVNLTSKKIVGRRAKRNVSQMAVEELDYTPVLEINEAINSCLADVNNCPTYPEGQLEEDWPTRFEMRDRAGCYFEFRNVNPSCVQACDVIFLTNSHSPELALPVSQACKMGCNYAIQAKQDNKQTCMLSCKNTVWDYSGKSTRCNRHNGLGIELPASAPLRIGVACEFGCVLGNERVCPECDRRSSTSKSIVV